MSRSERYEVVLVDPPVLHPMLPSLGTKVLAPACVQAGVRARVLEANVLFAGRIGFHRCGRRQSHHNGQRSYYVS